MRVSVLGLDLGRGAQASQRRNKSVTLRSYHVVVLATTIFVSFVEELPAECPVVVN